MKVTEVSLPYSNRIADDYVNDRGSIGDFFEYKPYDKNVYQIRQQHLNERVFERALLADHLLKYNKQFQPDELVLTNIERLKRNDSLVVIGGQQAGLLTGPLYTIHKIISIIQLAAKQEAELGVPVIPVFWIAGEDHDFAEINHVYVYENHQIVKKAIKQKQLVKTSVSNLEIDQVMCENWINDIIRSYGETIHTKALMELLHTALKKSRTYVEFFAEIVTRLFEGTGLVLVDSHHPELRRLESDFFQQLISHNMELGQAVTTTVAKLVKNGYSDPVGLVERNAHLFYEHNGARVLLELQNDHCFCGKQNECVLTDEDLIEIAINQPEKLSNNVLTRPLMQEFLFPTLAFVSGPGEVAYWALLKDAFRSFELIMPPVIPRQMITILDRKTEQSIKELGLTIAEILTSGTTEMKEQWLENQMSKAVKEDIELVKQEMDRVHERLRQTAVQVDPALKSLAEKNRLKIQEQVDYLERQIERSVRLSHETELRKYESVDTSLRPIGAPQERIWNVCYYLNQYGTDIIHQLLKTPYEWNSAQKVICV